RAVGEGVVLSRARALGEFGAVSVVPGRLAGRTQTLTLYVEERFQAFDLTGAYAASIVLAVLALLTLVAMRSLGRLPAGRAAWASTGRPSPSASAASLPRTTATWRCPGVGSPRCWARAAAASRPCAAG